MSGAEVGARCVIGQGCFVAGSVKIGEGSRVQNNVSLYDGVVLEDHVFVGPSAVFTNVKRPRAGFLVGVAGFERTILRSGSTIGANATIICGHEIGQGAMIGAGAVVTKDVPAFSLVTGVPARIRGWVCACGHSLVEGPELPIVGTILPCSKCSRRYAVVNPASIELTDDDAAS